METVNLQAAMDVGKALGTAQFHSSTSEFVIVPQGYRLDTPENLLAPHAPAPRRVKQQVRLREVDSFIRYVNTFKTPGAVIFCDTPMADIVRDTPAGPPSFAAVLDYHNPPTDTETGARWCEHKATCNLRYTEEWQRWNARDGDRMTQVDFATFVEENQAMIISPNGAELLELVQTLQGKNDIRCNSMVRLQNGAAKLLYEEDVTLKGNISTQASSIDFPAGLSVAIPPFEGGAAYRVECRLRYRIENRRLSLWFEMVDVHLVIQNCIDEMTKKIAAETGIVPFAGAPG